MKLFAILILTLSLLSACSESLEKGSKCPCKVKIPQLQEDGTYKLEVVELQTLEDVKKMSSSKIQVTVNPRFYNDGSVDELKPQAQYMINNDGVIIPTRTDTAEMFSIYKTMEDLYIFDKSIGVDKFLTYPRYVSLQTKSGRSKNSHNNAFYAPNFDRIVVLNYEGHKVPLSINPGVLAHEHSHAIFNKIINPIKNTASEMSNASLHNDELVLTPAEVDPDVEQTTGYNYLILKALDEGVADYWANLHTGLVNPYIASYGHKEKMDDRVILPRVAQMDEQRALEYIFNFKEFKKEAAMSGQDRVIHGAIYGKAVIYSNMLKSISEKMFSIKNIPDAATAKILEGQWIIASFQKLAKVVEVKGKTEIITQADILNSFVPENAEREILNSVCQDINLFLSFHSDKVAACSGF